jgi:DNA-binding NarL/FixJ family response regulator
MNIVIADDHALFRSGVRQLLGQEFPDASFMEAGSLEDMLSAVPIEAAPDLFMVDLNMPGVGGVDAIAALIDVFPRSKIVILSASEERRQIGAALAAGLNGYIPKCMTSGEILAALKSVLSGSTYVPVSLTRREAYPWEGHPRKRLDDFDLTQRQRHVLDEVLLGKSSKEIGRTLDITENTVKIHLAALYRALGVRSRSEAILKFKTAASLGARI